MFSHIRNIGRMTGQPRRSIAIKKKKEKNIFKIYRTDKYYRFIYMHIYTFEEEKKSVMNYISRSRKVTRQIHRMVNRFAV